MYHTIGDAFIPTYLDMGTVMYTNSSMKQKFADETLSGIVSRMSTVSEILERLKIIGYSDYLVLEGMELCCLQTHTHYHHLHFEVDEIFWVDGGHTNDGVTIFALNHRYESFRGIFVAL